MGPRVGHMCWPHVLVTRVGNTSAHHITPPPVGGWTRDAHLLAPQLTHHPLADEQTAPRARLVACANPGLHERRPGASRAACLHPLIFR